MEADRLYQIILDLSRTVDENFRSLPPSDTYHLKVTFPVPSFHPRSGQIRSYHMECRPFDPLADTALSSKPRAILICEAVARYIEKALLDHEAIQEVLFVPSIEATVKTRQYLDTIIQHNFSRQEILGNRALVVVGGGLLLNVGSYIAEKCNFDLILWPTTVLSMADGSGGKVRTNEMHLGRAYKHAYKSFYEPNGMFVDSSFLNMLPGFEVKAGLVEIIKHGIYQSPDLATYLVEYSQAILSSKDYLLKAIFWAANLKAICIAVDVEENHYGSRRILRGGHGYSDKLEEDGELRMSHGYAVGIGIMMELTAAGDKKQLALANELFGAYGIPKTLEEYRQYATREHN